MRGRDPDICAWQAETTSPRDACLQMRETHIPARPLDRHCCAEGQLGSEWCFEPLRKNLTQTWFCPGAGLLAQQEEVQCALRLEVTLQALSAPRHLAGVGDGESGSGRFMEKKAAARNKSTDFLSLPQLDVSMKGERHFPWNQYPQGASPL